MKSDLGTCVWGFVEEMMLRLLLSVLLTTFVVLPAHALPVYVTLTFTSIDDGAVIGGASFEFDPDVKTLVHFTEGTDSFAWLALITNYEGNLNGSGLGFAAQAGGHYEITDAFASADLSWNEATQKKDGTVSWGAVWDGRYGVSPGPWMMNGKYFLSTNTIQDIDNGRTIANVSYDVNAVPLPAAFLSFLMGLPLLLLQKLRRKTSL